ncbi:hypothetical protein [Paenibacillus wynnii]|uniref:Uncharacterized protein n=1 Tax=Paenibacillus wynnii TaxID=268407 RepID=A0A098M556_9BACL|nr:hypothetical protein [Paenibacillus wynnii]KGE17680.1 hypothetical protein PWYN_24220 [Paenibacillus wynnii]
MILKSFKKKRKLMVNGILLLLVLILARMLVVQIYSQKLTVTTTPMPRVEDTQVNTQEIEFEKNSTQYDVILINDTRTVGGSFESSFTCPPSNDVRIDVSIKNRKGTVKFKVYYGSKDFGFVDIKEGQDLTRSFKLTNSHTESERWKVYVTTADGHGIDIDVKARQINSNKVPIEEANRLILATQDIPKSSGKDMDLIEITPSDFWDQTRLQLFKMVGDSSWETFIVSKQKAVHIGNGFGGYGVTSAVPFDLNKDGTLDVVYAYSYGSGIHRSEISWLDLKNFTEHRVLDRPESTGFRMDDLILKNESKEIAVYRISGIDKSEINFDCLRTYPTKKDIEHMALEKIGVLSRENN